MLTLGVLVSWLLYARFIPEVADEDASTTADGKHASGSNSEAGKNGVSKGSPRKVALLQWFEEEDKIPDTIKKEIIDDIKKRGLEFGEYPFNSEQNAQKYFAWMYGQKTLDSDVMGGLANRASEKYLSKLLVACVSQSESLGTSGRGCYYRRSSQRGGARRLSH